MSVIFWCGAQSAIIYVRSDVLGSHRRFGSVTTAAQWTALTSLETQTMRSLRRGLYLKEPENQDLVT